MLRRTARLPEGYVNNSQLNSEDDTSDDDKNGPMYSSRKSTKKPTLTPDDAKSVKRGNIFNISFNEEEDPYFRHPADIVPSPESTPESTPSTSRPSSPPSTNERITYPTENKTPPRGNRGYPNITHTRTLPQKNPTKPTNSIINSAYTDKTPPKSQPVSGFSTPPTKKTISYDWGVSQGVRDDDIQKLEKILANHVRTPDSYSSPVLPPPAPISLSTPEKGFSTPQRTNKYFPSSPVSQSIVSKVPSMKNVEKLFNRTVHFASPNSSPNSSPDSFSQSDYSPSYSIFSSTPDVSPNHSPFKIQISPISPASSIESLSITDPLLYKAVSETDFGKMIKNDNISTYYVNFDENNPIFAEVNNIRQEGSEHIKFTLADNEVSERLLLNGEVEANRQDIYIMLRFGYDENKDIIYYDYDTTPPENYHAEMAKISDGYIYAFRKYLLYKKDEKGYNENATVINNGVYDEKFFNENIEPIKLCIYYKHNDIYINCNILEINFYSDKDTGNTKIIVSFDNNLVIDNKYIYRNLFTMIPPTGGKRRRTTKRRTTKRRTTKRRTTKRRISKRRISKRRSRRVR